MTIKILLAAIGGIVPALVWLYFWLKEDRLHPEPKRLIAISFVLGMLSVFPTAQTEHWIESALGAGSVLLVIFLWSFSEEFFKFLAASIGGLRRKEYDQPIDALIYLITAALGFSALENSLFILSSFVSEGFISGIELGNTRFVGASLLHVLASGTIGLFLAISFYKKAWVRFSYFVMGILSATLIHSLFNIKLVEAALSNSKEKMFTVFALVWLAIILLLVGFEKVKRLRPLKLPHLTKEVSFHDDHVDG